MPGDDVRISLAAAMTIGLEPGLFYRGARLGCVNLLESHPDGCTARCAYCGLSRTRPGSYAAKGFIRVRWPTLPFRVVLDAMEASRERYERVCISMITRRGAAGDLVEMATRIRERMDKPISALVSPTVTDTADLAAILAAGVDRVGVAVDAATPDLFDALRGRSGGGPHRWDRYWEVFGEAVELFGSRMAGCHLIVGLGETEEQMASAIQRVRDAGGVTHLFSFCPEPGSVLEGRAPPPVGQYRRVQVARYLIDEGISEAARFGFDGGRIASFGVDPGILDPILESGAPFETSGCPGPDGRVACNRPFANTRPGPDLRNYPFPLEPGDVMKARSELWT